MDTALPCLMPQRMFLHSYSVLEALIYPQADTEELVIKVFNVSH